MSGGRSFTTRLLLPVVGAAALVIVAGLYVDYRLSRERLLADLTASATLSIDSTLQRLDELRLGVESVVRLASEAVRERPDPARTDELLRSLVESNDHIFGASFALASSTSAPAAGHYVYRDERREDRRSVDLASDPESPGDWRWFERARDDDTAQWVGPYAAGRVGGELVSSFSAPLRDDRGAFIAAIAADISLGSLAPYLDDLAIDDRGFGFLLTRDGLVIGAPLDGVIALPLAELYPALADVLPRDSTPQALQARVPCPRDSGTCELRIRPAGPGPWAVGVVYASDEVLKPLHDYARRVFAIGLLMLGVLALIVAALTQRLTRPLRELARSSRAIARGELDSDLPRITSNDEVGDLVSAFDAMRRDLGNYIAELERSTAQRARLEGQFAAAAEIQRSMLPGGGQAEVTETGYMLWARLRPARAVGGDLYSYAHHEDQVRFAIGDVSDKGIAAALFMARAMGLVEEWLVQDGGVPPEIALAQLNDSLSQDNERCMFLTLTLGHLDLSTGELCFASGGHAPPLLLRGSEVHTAQQRRGPALALEPEIEFPPNRLMLRSDDRLLFYTDGFDEARNLAGDALGESPLAEAMLRFDDRALGTLGDALFALVDEFAGDAPQHDDMTLLLIERPGKRLAPQQVDERGFAVDEKLVGDARHWLRERGRGQGVEGPILGDLELMLEEILCNIRDYSGLGRTDNVSVRLARFADRMELRCVDGGVAFNPLTDAQGAELGASTENAEIGGLGVHLVKRLSDRHSYHREDERNILRVERRLGEDAKPTPDTSEDQP